MKPNATQKVTREAFLVIGLLAIVIGIAYWAYYTHTLLTKLDSTESDLASSTIAYNINLQQLQDKEAAAEKENQNLLGVLSDAQKKNLDLETTNQNSSKEISSLIKLATTDPELLKKYSKIYFLNENYVPAHLTDIDSTYLIDPTKNIQILSEVYPFLTAMLDDAHNSNVPLLVLSGYRSFEYQTNLKLEYKMTYGTTAANSFSADQGYSEHQLGTALDFTTLDIMGADVSFDKTSAYTWLVANAYRYGFVLSYPKGNSYYVYEPWHWRFVGKALALDLHENNENFYDMDQRSIDAYLLRLFDN